MNFDYGNTQNCYFKMIKTIIIINFMNYLFSKAINFLINNYKLICL